MKRAIFIRFFIVIIMGLFLCGSFSSLMISHTMLDRTRQDMYEMLRFIDAGIDYTGDLQQELQRILPKSNSSNKRITILDGMGKVVADSGVNNLEQLDNHIDRQEIEEALHGNIGFSSRYSNTLHKKLLYISSLSETSPYIIRLAIPFNGLSEYMILLFPAIFFSIIVALIVSALLAGRFSETITDPLTEISEELLKIQDRSKNLFFREYQYEELNQIAMTSKNLSDTIQKTMEKLEMERNKIETILNNMTEGFIMLDDEQGVLLINQAARRLLHCEKEALGQNLIHYTKNIPVLNGVKEALQKQKNSIFDIQDSKNRIYSVHISVLHREVFLNSHKGAIVLFVDATSDRKAQKIRQEFFSNASHELKTPITSIQGYTELLESGMITAEEQKKEYLRRIKKEVQNMTNLINDILMISKLEADQSAVPFIEVNLKGIIDDVVNSLIPLAASEEVTFQVDCEEAFMLANPQQIQQLVNNLVSNAVKYNRKGGSVDINVRNKAAIIEIEISDTGIGIPVESQGRIFERFYRVDKGRSKKMGGTGLGLSIVKHIVQFYQGSITLRSKVGEGTLIEMRLPKVRIQNKE